jgi:hypothetical protein
MSFFGSFFSAAAQLAATCISRPQPQQPNESWTLKNFLEGQNPNRQPNTGCNNFPVWPAVFGRPLNSDALLLFYRSYNQFSVWKCNKVERLEPRQLKARGKHRKSAASKEQIPDTIWVEMLPP